MLLLFGACGGADGGGATAESAGMDGTDQDLMQRRSAMKVGGNTSVVSSAGGSSGGGGSSGSIGYSDQAQALDAELPAADARAADEAATSGGSIPDIRQSSRVPVGPSVIKTATVEISIERKRFKSAVQAATTIAERYGGFVVSTALDDGKHGFAAATLRIPADKFADAMHGVRGLGEVESEEISGEDVSQQLIDLEARIRNLRSQEVVLLRLMRGANTVLETIRIQDHLSGVQLEIERLRGRLTYLDDQVTYSTIYVQMREAGAPARAKTGIIGRAWQQAIEGSLSVVGGVIVAAGFVIPIALIVGIAALVFRAFWPRISRKVPSAT